MAKKKRKQADASQRNDFLKTVHIREHNNHVKFELVVDNLKIASVAELIEHEGDKVLSITGWTFSMRNHKYVYCVHLLLEYMRYYSELNKLPLIAQLPGKGIPVELLPEDLITKRQGLTDLYLDHEFQQADGDPETFLSVLDPSVHIPKKVDLIGMHYGTTNRLVMGSGGSNVRHHHEKSSSPEHQNELVPPEQG